MATERTALEGHLDEGPSTEKLIITVAVNGGELRESDTPYVPITPEAIASSTREAVEAGAAIAHIHVRGEDGSPSMDASRTREVIEFVRAECDVIINLSTDLRIASNPDVLDLDFEIASLPVASIELGEGLLSAPPARVRSIARSLIETGKRPELELFHEGMITTARRLVAEGYVNDPVFAQFCLGFDGGASADLGAAFRMRCALPSDWLWSLVGVGLDGVAMTATAIILGGHVRVGIEDNPYYAPGVLARSNAELVARVVRLAAEFGRPVATPAEAREMLGLKSTDGGSPTPHTPLPGQDLTEIAGDRQR